MYLKFMLLKYLQKLDPLLPYKSETNNMLLKYYNYRIKHKSDLDMTTDFNCLESTLF